MNVADVRAFLADEGGVRTSAAAAKTRRPQDDGTTQTTLPALKRTKMQAPPPTEL